MDTFVVEFDRPLAVYLPGQTVSGIISFTLTEPERIKGLTVECIGKGQVQWSETETVGRDTETTYYQASENYYYHKATVFTESGEEDMEPGEYSYPFAFTLPYQLPTSFEGVHGSLRYYVRAQLLRFYTLDAVFKKGFTVNNIVDLNLIYQASMPVKNEDSKTVCCWCCQSGPITAYAWIPKTGYVPGEPIIFCGQIENHSRSRLLSTSIQLVEKTIFRAQGKVKESDRVLGEITRTAPQSRQAQSSSESLDLWDHVPLIVPPVPPSDLHLCNIIDLYYVLEFVVNPGTLSFNFKVPLDIIIGTVPLTETFSTFQPSAPPIHDLTSEGSTSVPPFKLNHYPDLPPPTYENGPFVADLREEGDTEALNIGFDTLFVPNYLTYTTTSNDDEEEEDNKDVVVNNT